MKHGRGTKRGRPAAGYVRNPPAEPWSNRPALIGRLLWAQQENLRSIKGAFLVELADETDVGERRRLKRYLRRMLHLVRDALVVAEEQIERYEPRYYDLGRGEWRKLTAAVKQERARAAAEQAARWSASRRRREAEIAAVEEAQRQEVDKGN